jgi:beta-glucosidase
MTKKIKHRDRKTFEARAKALVDQMTLTEKVSQLLHKAPAIERLGIPAYNWWSEGLHGVARAGVATMFPQAIGLAASFDTDMMYEVGDIISTEARARYNTFSKLGDRDIYKGLTIWSPNINIFRDPRWGRGQETYGEDPVLTSDLAVEFIRGLQGDDPTYLKTAACAKHFACYSGPEDLRHEFDAVVSDKDLEESYFPAFQACVEEANVESVMSAYNRVNGFACSASPYLLQDVLRDKWGFEGHVVSDCWAIADIFKFHRLVDNPVDATAMSIEAGCDLNCGSCYGHAVDAVIADKLDEAKVDQALIRLFTTRMLLGLFEEEGQVSYDQLEWTVNDSPKHREKNLEVALKVPVLLKNDGILPLAKGGQKTIGLIGPNARNIRALEGNYEGTASRYWTVLDGLQDYLADTDTRLLFSEGCHLYKDRMSGLAEANDRLSEVQAVCQASDVIIACFGLDPGLEGEQGDQGNQFASGDKPDLGLPGIQREILETIYSYNKPTILLIMSGSAVALDQDVEKASAILQCWYPGSQGGKAIAQILFGDHSPEGKLPVTFYSEHYELPDFKDYSMIERTYRFATQGVLYPFGFGLTYGKAKVLSADWKEDRSLCVQVKNESDVDIRETVQVYVKAPQFGPVHPELKAFRKVALKAGEEKAVHIKLDGKAFRVVNDEGQSVSPKGQWKLYVGFGQPDVSPLGAARKDLAGQGLVLEVES